MSKKKIAAIICGVLLILIGVGLFQLGSNLLQQMGGYLWDLARLSSFTAQRAYEIALNIKNSGIIVGMIGIALVGIGIRPKK
ncbi:MAG: hypothetical protein V1894_06110 [Chloroflexota bacterium]